MNPALLLRESDYSVAHFPEFRFPRLPKISKFFRAHSLLLRFLLVLTLISVFIYFVRKWFFFDFTFAKVKHVLTYFDTSSSKPQTVSGWWEWITSPFTGGNSAFSQGVNATLDGVKKVTSAVTTVKGIFTDAADSITKKVLDTVSDAVENVTGNVSTVVGGVQSTTSGSVISWTLMGGSGILGILLALLFIL